MFSIQISNAVTLQKTVDHIGKLQQERQQLQEQVKRLREEIEELNTSIKYVVTLFTSHPSQDWNVVQPVDIISSCCCFTTARVRSSCLPRVCPSGGNTLTTCKSSMNTWRTAPYRTGGSGLYPSLKEIRLITLFVGFFFAHFSLALNES